MIKDCHVGVKGIVCVNDKCLLLQKGTGDDAFWEVPGGRIDGSETIEATLTRELHEELPNIGNFTIGDIVGAYRLEHDLEGERGLVLIFYKVIADDFDVVLSSEHTDYMWVTKNDLKDMQDKELVIKPKLYEFLTRVLEEG